MNVVRILRFPFLSTVQTRKGAQNFIENEIENGHRTTRKFRDPAISANFYAARMASPIPSRDVLTKGVLTIGDSLLTQQ